MHCKPQIFGNVSFLWFIPLKYIRQNNDEFAQIRVHITTKLGIHSHGPAHNFTDCTQSIYYLFLFLRVTHTCSLVRHIVFDVLRYLGVLWTFLVLFTVQKLWKYSLSFGFFFNKFRLYILFSLCLLSTLLAFSLLFHSVAAFPVHLIHSTVIYLCASKFLTFFTCTLFVFLFLPLSIFLSFPTLTCRGWVVWSHFQVSELRKLFWSRLWMFV